MLVVCLSSFLLLSQVVRTRPGISHRAPELFASGGGGGLDVQGQVGPTAAAIRRQRFDYLATLGVQLGGAKTCVVCGPVVAAAVSIPFVIKSSLGVPCSALCVSFLRSS